MNWNELFRTRLDEIIKDAHKARANHYLYEKWQRQELCLYIGLQEEKLMERWCSEQSLYRGEMNPKDLVKAESQDWLYQFEGVKINVCRIATHWKWV